MIINNIEEVNEKIKDLKKIKSNLRQKLNNYQDEFSKTHNRKIKFVTDRIPVENEYKEYK